MPSIRIIFDFSGESQPMGARHTEQHGWLKPKGREETVSGTTARTDRLPVISGLGVIRPERIRGNLLRTALGANGIKKQIQLTCR
jgi:hypothetical protein